LAIHATHVRGVGRVHAVGFPDIHLVTAIAELTYKLTRMKQ
jgi:hypothetical protein